MTTKRIIPCMDIRDGRVVKGVNFENIQDLADPVEMARYYNESGADELAFYDIAASFEGRTLFFDLLGRVAREVSIPLLAGGGIISTDDFERALQSGASKVSVNSGVIADPDLIDEASRRFGRECVVIAMDVKRTGGQFRLYARGGRTDTGREATQWARECEERGAGELVLNSIDTDGVKNGFDVELLAAVAECVSIPIVASGGAGCMKHFADLFKALPVIDAGLAASIFHRKEVSIGALKEYLQGLGIPVRLGM